MTKVVFDLIRQFVKKFNISIENVSIEYDEVEDMTFVYLYTTRPLKGRKEKQRYIKNLFPRAVKYGYVITI